MNFETSHNNEQQEIFKEEEMAIVPETIFYSYIEKGIAAAEEEVKKRFEFSSEKNNLSFHAWSHSLGVARRAEKIMHALHTTERKIKLARFIGVYHDIVQEWDPVLQSADGRTTLAVLEKDAEGNAILSSVRDTNNNPVEIPELYRIFRKRRAGENERKSAEMAIDFMENANKEAEERGLPEVFTVADVFEVQEAILNTIPGFDPNLGTVIQPNLTADDTFIGHAVALGDLGTAGMEGAGAYLPEGDALFREEQLDILDRLKKPNLGEEEKKFIMDRFIAWSDFQPKFAQGRMVNLESELGGLTPEAKRGVFSLFTKFDETMAASKAKAEERRLMRQEMKFEDLVRDMGYQIQMPLG